MIRWNSFSGAVLFSSILHLLLFFSAGVFPRVSGRTQTVSFPSERMLDVLYAGKMFSETLQAPQKVEPEVTLPKQTTPLALPELKTEPEFEREVISSVEQGTFPPWPDAAGGAKGLSDEEAVANALQLTEEERPIFYAYYQTVRERIRQRLQRQYLPGKPGEGTVALSFILFSSGKLKTAEVLGEKSFQNRKLRALAMESVIQASPFPPFPEGLRRPLIPFRVVITFIGE